MMAVLYCISKIYKKGDVIEKKPLGLKGHANIKNLGWFLNKV